MKKDTPTPETSESESPIISDVLEFELTEPLTLDKREYTKLYIRKPKAKDRFTALANAGSNAPAALVVMEGILLCASVKHPTLGKDISITRDAYYTLSWKDSHTLENRFFEFVGSVL